MSISKIKAGLNAKERAKSGTPSPAISTLLGAPATVSQLKNTVGGIVERRDRLRKLTDDLAKNLERQKAEIEAKYKDFGKHRDENGVTIDEIGSDRRHAMIQREFQKFARSAKATTADARTKLLTEIRELHAKVRAVSDAWSHPVAVLDRRTLSDQKRAIYMQTLAHANPVSVAHHMRAAITTGDGPLVLALVARTTAFSDEVRDGLPYTSQDLAEAIPGVLQEMNAAREMLALSDYATGQAEFAQATAEGNATTEMRVRAGRLQKAYEDIAGKPEEIDDSEDKESGPPSLFTEEEWQAMLDGKYPSAPVPDNVTVIGGVNA